MKKLFVPLVLSVILLSMFGNQNVYAMTFDVDSNGPLPDLAVVPFTVTASGESCTIQDIDVRLAIQHTFVFDLSLTLQSPLGTVVQIVDQPLSGLEDYPDIILDDSATLTVENDAGVPNPGPTAAGKAYVPGASYKPNFALAAFNGENPNGVWNIVVTDNAGADVGFLFKAGDAAPWPYFGGGPAIGTQLIITPSGNCNILVGGDYFTLDTTALLVAGIQTNLAWIIPVLSAAVIGAVVLRKKF